MCRPHAEGDCCNYFASPASGDNVDSSAGVAGSSMKSTRSRLSRAAMAASDFVGA